MLVCLTRIKLSHFTSIYFCDVTSFHLGQKASLHSAPALASTQAPWTLAYHLLRWQADCYVDDGHLLAPPGLSNANLLAMMSAIDDEDGVIGSVQEEQAVRIQSAFRSKRAKARLGREKDAKLKSITAAAEAHAELKSLLKKTFNSVGADRASERAVDAMKILSELHIQTPEQLKQALDEPDLVRELQSRVLRGLLLPAARAQLRLNDVRAEWHLRGQEVIKPKFVPPERLVRELQVCRVDFSQVSAIDQISQTFRARVLIILKFVKGALDKDLIRDDATFPVDEWGRPTFRPSALWYLSNLDFLNGRDIKTLESKVTVAGDDLQLIKRVEGQFFERFELQSFPFDCQDLSITLVSHCALQGPVPCQIGMSDDAQLRVDLATFAFGDEWHLSSKITPECQSFGPTPTRRFPAVHLRAMVVRRPGFIMLNVYFPTMIIALLSLVTYVLDDTLVAAKLDLSMAILLTAVAFKFATAAYLPQISYPTIIDKYVMLCFGLITFSILLHAILGGLREWVERPEEEIEIANKACFGIVAALWIAIQLYFFAMRHLALAAGSNAGVCRSTLLEYTGEWLPEDAVNEVRDAASASMRRPKMVRQTSSMRQSQRTKMGSRSNTFTWKLKRTDTASRVGVAPTRVGPCNHAPPALRPCLDVNVGGAPVAAKACSPGKIG